MNISELRTTRRTAFESFSSNGSPKATTLSHSLRTRIDAASEKALRDLTPPSSPKIPEIDSPLSPKKDDSFSDKPGAYTSPRRKSSTSISTSIRPKTPAPKSLEDLLFEAKECIRIICFATGLSYVKEAIYKDLDPKLSELKSYIDEIAGLNRHSERRLKAYKLLLTRKTTDLQGFIYQKLTTDLDRMTRRDLKDLSKNLGELQSNYINLLSQN